MKQFFKRATPEDIATYLKKAQEVHATRQEVERASESTQASGDISHLQHSFQQLTCKTKELQDIRERIGPIGVFLAQYGVEVLDKHTVGYVMPRNATHLEMIRAGLEALQGSITISEPTLASWEKSERFTTPASEPQYIHVQARVRDCDGKSEQRQQHILKEMGVELVGLENLAAAFVAFYAARSASIFGTMTYYGADPVIRANGGGLQYTSGVRHLHLESTNDAELLSAAVLLPPETVKFLRPKKPRRSSE
jgi:hypothetical protein